MSKGTFGSLIDHELSQGLVYSFTIVENPSQPGSRKIRLFDRFRFKVVIENRSEIPVRDLRGVISRTDITEFEPTPFSLDRLEPGKSADLAEIDGSIVREPGTSFVFDEIGVVSATAFADLGFIAYQEWDKPLVAQHGSRPGAARAAGTDEVAGALQARRDLWGSTIPVGPKRRRS